jgi:hypothetical protein
MQLKQVMEALTEQLLREPLLPITSYIDRDFHYRHWVRLHRLLAPHGNQEGGVMGYPRN